MFSNRKAIYYQDSTTKREPVKEWLNSLKDKVGKAKVMVRIARAEFGNFGDRKSVGDGVLELRVNYGPGYRIYYALDGPDIILLLIGGDKSTQKNDITLAKEFWKKYVSEEN